MTQQLILDVLSVPPPTLANFIVGENAAVIDALDRCTPGRAVYLWGAPGSGRTHLLQAVSDAPDAVYVGAQNAAANLAGLIDSDCAGLTTIAVDNIELFDSAAQAALFALYNRWRESASSTKAFALVLAGDRAPLTLSVREDLRTRLGWDLVFRLELLTDEQRTQALNTQAAERGLKLAPDVLKWLLTHYARNMSQLSALLDALDRYSLEKHRAVTLPLLKDLLARATPANPDTTE